MDYQKSFEFRIKSYLSAINKFPNVLSEEFTNAIELLKIKDGEILLNIPAGGIPIDKYIKEKISYLAYDTHKGFISENIKYCNWDDIPLNSHSVDKIICLASLHHLNEFERIKTYNEFHRILKPTGMLLIGDVIENSEQSFWLNNFVNMYNSSGHKGKFFTESDAMIIEKQNFNVETVIKNYNWLFDKNEDVIVFCKLLFGLDMILNDNILNEAINDILKYKNGKIPWKLIYFICKPILFP